MTSSLVEEQFSVEGGGPFLVGFFLLLRMREHLQEVALRQTLLLLLHPKYRICILYRWCTYRYACLCALAAYVPGDYEYMSVLPDRMRKSILIHGQA